MATIKIGLKTTDSDGNKMKFAGIPIYMDGKEWIIPSLSVRQLREYEKKMRDLAGVTPENVMEQLDEILPIMHAAISRNYPDLKKEDLLDLIDIESMKLVMGAITNASGFREVRSGEAGAATEERSTGAGSLVH